VAVSIKAKAILRHLLWSTSSLSQSHVQAESI